MAAFDPKNLSWFRGKTIYDAEETEYRLVGKYLERKDALIGEDEGSDMYEVSLLCAMTSARIQEMKEAVNELGTRDKAAIHDKLTEYLNEDDHAQPPEPGLLLIGLLPKQTYVREGHSWRHPAVVSKSISRVE